MYARIVQLAGILVLGPALVSCTSGTSPSPAMSSEMPMGSDSMETDVGALGEPADAADADRTVHILATDDLDFDPDTVDVTVGETITFEIENTGTVDHEFVLGSADFQAQHEEEMQGGEMEMGEPNEIEVPASETTTLTWHFTEAGMTQYGCHEPGHFPAGMVGTITVTE